MLSFSSNKNGKIINYETNRKNRGYDTIVPAAPITINEAPYYEVIIGIRDSKTQRFYVHKVITEKGLICCSRPEPTKMLGNPATYQILLLLV